MANFFLSRIFFRRHAVQDFLVTLYISRFVARVPSVSSSDFLSGINWPGHAAVLFQHFFVLTWVCSVALISLYY